MLRAESQRTVIHKTRRVIHQLHQRIARWPSTYTKYRLCSCTCANQALKQSLMKRHHPAADGNHYTSLASVRNMFFPHGSGSLQLKI